MRARDLTMKMLLEAVDELAEDAEPLGPLLVPQWVADSPNGMFEAKAVAALWGFDGVEVMGPVPAPDPERLADAVAEFGRALRAEKQQRLARRTWKPRDAFRRKK